MDKLHYVNYFFNNFKVKKRPYTEDVQTRAQNSKSPQSDNTEIPVS